MPTGTVTFLFSDIEGSTNRWEHHHAAMTKAVARHDVLIRGEIERHGGFVFKTVGDAFCGAFSTPQQRMYAEDFSAVGGLRVRMGIHVGTAVERDSDYYGPAVNRVARLMSIGHGGQVLVSDAVILDPTDLVTDDRHDLRSETLLQHQGGGRLTEQVRPNVTVDIAERAGGEPPEVDQRRPTSTTA